MQETFLHYIWQHQYFDKQDLLTTDGEAIQIVHPGFRNTHAGPDFFNARIRIGSIEWVGSVEIHVNASAWLQHKHDLDAAYDNVVLHVVWKNDKPVHRNDSSQLTSIELKNRVDENLLLRCNKLVNSPDVIPCAGMLATVPDIIRFSMLDRTVVQRLDEKSQRVLDLYERNQHDWEETCYQLLCRNFGFKINSEPFLQLAQALPYKTLLKHADNLLQLEALLFGQAGLLEESSMDAYYALLAREYSFLSHKYQLEKKRMNKAQWRFLRLRPANFPTIRLAQLAMLIHQRKNIFSAILSIANAETLKQFFRVTQSQYWCEHYQFFKKLEGSIAGLGDASIENILINTVAPLLTACSRQKDDPALIDRAVDILQQCDAEDNAVIRQWNALGMRTATAFDSQGLLGLHQDYCLRKKCLECNIGASFVKSPRS